MRLVATFFACLLSCYSVAQGLTQAQLAEFAAEADLRFGTVQNYGDGGIKVSLTLNNKSSVALPKGKGDWTVYLHSVRKIADLEVSGVVLSHIQGDLHQLVPTADFAGLAAGETLSIVYLVNASMASYSDYMPRAFIYRKGLEPAIFASTDTEDLAQFIEPFTREEQLLRNNDPDLFPIANAQLRYQENLALNKVKLNSTEALQRIIPTPKDISYRRGSARLDSRWQIRYAGQLTHEAEYLRERLNAALGAELNSQPDHIAATGKVIELKVNAKASGKSSKTPLPSAAESYSLTITADKIEINGSDNAGAFYGLQSLLGLLPATTASSYSLPLLTAIDSPRASWRGMHYDMGRNFHGKEVTLRLIEQMARYKLNKLHLHLTEDEGWRLEIPGLPELTEIGAFRCFDLTEERCLLTQLGTGPFKTGSGNGYYSTEDFIEILRYAAARHIEVIPEIDMPGHARAAVKAMDARYKKLLAAGKKAEAEQYLLADPADKSKYITVQNYTDNSINVCLPSTYAFVDKVMYELQQMYRKAGLKLETFHMGGDEVGAGSWTASPVCEALFASETGVAGVADLKPYFVSKVADLANKRGLALAGWEDGLMYDAANTFNRAEFNNKRVIANAWDNIWEWGVADRAYRLANDSYQVILSSATHLYFDHPHEAHPQERGYYWAARYTDAAKVFGFMPDNLYANAEKTRSGATIDNLDALVGRPQPGLQKPDNLLGMQGQVWTETIRTAEQLEQMIYPRLIPLAERAWHKAAWESDKPNRTMRAQEWAGFAHTLVHKELPRLVAAGVSFHLPPPGAVLDNGKLVANTAYPELTIEYSLDQGASWQKYMEPVTLGATPALLRTRSQDVVSRATRLE
jgi:hexosaminidase